MPSAARLIVRSLASDYSAGAVIDGHRHDWRQIVFAEAGVMRVLGGRDEYFTPPSMAASIPAGLDHALRMETPVRLRTLYVRADLEEGPREAAVLAVSPFLRELIRRIVAIGLLSGDDPEHVAFATVLLRELRDAPVLPLSMRRPADARAQRAADLIDRGVESLDDIAREAGASARTLQRLFLDETGMRFSHWRQQRRLLLGAEALSRGANVGASALAAGYQSQSAFVAAFARQFGATPMRWAALRRD